VQTKLGRALPLALSQMTDLPLQELPSLLERVRPRLKEQDYRLLEGMVQILQGLEELQLLGVAPEELEAALAAAERRLGGEPPGLKPAQGTGSARIPPAQSSEPPAP
jgi:hypothetical protein